MASNSFGPPPPPMRIGGCGCWTGFGHEKVAGKSTNSPE
jgi:hypothetical protein